MTKSWRTAVFIALMGIQTVTSVAHLLPVHADSSQSGDQVVQHWDDGHELDAGDEDGNFTEQCHSRHCHGSHLLLAMQPIEIEPVPRADFIANSQTQHPPGHVTVIYRPPIA